MNQTVTHAATHPAAVSPIVPRADRTTRQLVIAAHLYPIFAARVIKEYLAEPRRSLPSGVGLNAAAVVYEAVAAHARRRIRDWILVVLLVLLAPTSWAALIPWFGAAVARRLISVKLPRSLSGISKSLLVAILLLPVAFLLFSTLLAGGFIAVVAAISVTVRGMGFVLFPTIFAILLTDRLIEWWLVTRSFPIHGTTRSWPHERKIRTLGVNRFSAQIDAVARHAAQGNVLVFRGERPFVGAGIPVLSKSFAIPLVPAESDDPDQGYLPHRNNHEQIARFVPTDLYSYVWNEFLKLRSGDSLAPSMRLRNLDLSHFVAVAAEELLSNFAHPRASWVLRDPAAAPVAVLPREQVMEAADRPVEWMRYFQQIQIESWDRELVVTLFLHVGCDDRMLYVEWTCCVLSPIDPRFRDLMPPRKPWRAAFSDLVDFPLTIVDRLRNAARRIGPDKASEFVSASTYGTASSIREMASSNGARSYFEKADVDRYCAILIRHMSGAIADFLASRGISTREFANRVTSIINNSVNNYGNNYGSMSGPGEPVPSGKPD
jgi:hypothetical protein